MISAFVFDLDGVITDTAEYHYRSWKRLAEEEGIPFTREDNEQLRGVSRRESLLLLLKGRVLAESQMQEWMERKNNYYRQYLKEITSADLLPGVQAFLTETRAYGLKIGLASASKNAKDVLNGLGIMALFDAVGDGYSVSNTKPAPDLFVWVAGRLDLPPDRVVIFEDAEAGIAGALAAGMYAIGLGPAERVGKAHVILPDLRDAHVQALLDRLPATPR
ncbi:MAG: beta-phosphoglucomutase [Anaerolineae bacterium]|nr:beta-phosphoglucomutase [Anaerolineae bacterium]